MTEQHREEKEQYREEMPTLIAQLTHGQPSAPVTSPSCAHDYQFCASDPTSELWKDYWSRFQICMEENSIPTEC